MVTFPPGGGSVLVVEDDADLRAAVADILEDAGFEVHVAENGEDALLVVRELERHGQRPCLVLLDLMMPVMDGFGFMERLRADPRLRELPVVVSSASAREPPEGARAMLRKPFEIPHLLDAVASHCRARPGPSALDPQDAESSSGRSRSSVASSGDSPPCTRSAA